MPSSIVFVGRSTSCIRIDVILVGAAGDAAVTPVVPLVRPAMQKTGHPLGASCTLGRSMQIRMQISGVDIYVRGNFAPELRCYVYVLHRKVIKSWKRVTCLMQILWEINITF